MSLIVLFYLLCGALYAWRIPPFEGPDEAQHFAYITWLTEGKGLPPQGAAAWETPVEQEAGQPPLYYFLASIPARIVGVSHPAAVYRPNPYFVAPLPRSVPDNDNRAIHYPTDGRPLRGGWLSFYLARGLTLAFGVLLIVSVHGLARQAWPGKPEVALAAAGLTAVNPQVIYIGSMASNDVPAAALSALALWLFAAYWRGYDRLPPAWGAGVGAALGLAALTKVSALTLGLPVGLGLAWLWLTGRRTPRQVLAFGLLFGGGVLLTAGWWLGRNWLLYGSPVGLEAHYLTPWAITNRADMDPFALRWLEVARSFWLSLGWGTIRFGPWPGGWVYTVFFGLMGAAMIGWGVRAWRWRAGGARPATHTLVLLLLLLAGLGATAVLLEQWMQRVIAPYGRLLFPSLGGIVLVLVLGWRGLHPRLPWAAIGFTAACALAVPFTLIPAAYEHTFLSEAEAAALPPAIGWQFGDADGRPFAELLSFTPQRRSMIAYDVLPVEVCWRALNPVAQNHTVLLQVIGPENSLIGGRRTYPGQGLYPTSIWQPDRVWCDLLHVFVPEEIPGTQVYRLELAMLDDATGARLPAWDRQGNPLPHNFLDVVRVETRQPPPQVDTPLAAPPPIHLLAADFADTWPVGTAVPLTLRWAAAEPLAQDYQVFVHLRAPETGENVAQADGPPHGGWYPTSWWPVGEIVSDARAFPLPADLLPGEYQLVVGFYELETGARVGAEHVLGAVRLVR